MDAHLFSWCDNLIFIEDVHRGAFYVGLWFMKLKICLNEHFFQVGLWFLVLLVLSNRCLRAPCSLIDVSITPLKFLV